MPLMTTDVPASLSRSDVDEWLCREDAVVSPLDNPGSIDARERYIRGIRAAADAAWEPGIGRKKWRRRTRDRYFRAFPTPCYLLRLTIDRLLAWEHRKIAELYAQHPEFCPHA